MAHLRFRFGQKKIMSSRKDLYNVLEIDRDASEADIKRAYRKLALKYHPDKSKHPDATKRFQEISEAYSVLSDRSKRRRYDLGGSGTFERFNDDFGFTSWCREDFTMEDAFNVFTDFMYGGDIPEIFREESMEYHQVEVPFEVAQNGGDIEIYLEREDKRQTLHIDGVWSGKWKPFICVGDNNTAILKVSFPPEMSLAERRKLQKIFLGLHAISMATNAVKDIVENHPFLGVLGLGIGVAALCLFSSK